MPNSRAPFTEYQLTRFAEAVVGDLRTPMVIIDQQLQVLAVSPPFRDLLATSDDPLGQDLLSLYGGQWDVPELRQALANVLSHEQSFDDVEVPGPGGDPLYVSARALHTEGGKPELIVVEFDQAHAVARTGASQENARIAEEIVATVREPLLVLDYDHCVTLANQSFYRVFRLSREEVAGRHLTEVGNGEWDIPELRQELKSVLGRDRYFNDLEVEHDFAEIGQRTMLLNARRIDHLRLILLAIEDVTERRQQERQQQLVVAELAHRVQNLLAVIQSIASQTRAESADEFRAALIGRLRALAMAYGVLFESGRRTADLEGMLRQIVAPHVDDTSDRVRLAGPPVTLSADQVTGLALIANELATNAAKHGALSSESGHVAISWTMVSDQLHMEWKESGGPAVEPAPVARFGTRLIERTASYQLRGQAELKFEPTGLVSQLEFPLAD
ncbi:MAG: HWE histidine kinase domain-containing protein [Dehalococcoidia bacterium]